LNKEDCKIAQKSTNKNPYERFEHDELILRDQLAIDRSILANERTLLAYCRTSLAIALTGAGFIKFFAALPLDLLGFVLILSGVVIVTVGFRRFRIMDRKLKTIGQDDTEPSKRPALNIKQ